MPPDEVTDEQLEAARQLTAGQQQIQDLFFAARRSRQELGPEAAEVALKGFIETAEAYKARLAAFAQQYGPFGSPESTIDAQVTCLILLGEMAESAGRLADALDYYDSAEDVAARELSPLGRIAAELRLANGRASAGGFHVAISSLHEARDRLDTVVPDDETVTKIHDLRFELTNRLADIYDWLGDMERAEQELTVAENLVRQPASGAAALPDTLSGLDPMKAGDLAQFIEIASNLTRGLKPGEPEEADSLLAGLLGVEDQTTATSQQLNVKLRRAILLKKLGKLEEAWDVFQEIAPAYAGMSEAAGYGVDYHLAGLEREKGDPTAASQRIDHILSRIGTLYELQPKAGQIIMVKAECYRDLVENEAAFELIEYAIASLEQYEQRDSLWKAYWLKAQLLGSANPQSLQEYDRAIGIIDGLRHAPLGYRLDNAYLEDKRPLVEEAIRAAIGQDDAAAACRFMEAAKSRALMTLLSVPPDESLPGDPVDAEIDALGREIDAAEWQTFAGEETSANREDLISRRQALLERKLIADPRWRTLRQPRPFDLPAIQQILADKNLTALDLFLVGETIISVLITGGSVRADQRELSERTCRMLQVYDNNLTCPHPDPLSQDPLNLGLELTDFLPDSILEVALETSGLIISPHRGLHLLPWAGLPYKNGRLFDHTAVAILPNLSCLPLLATTGETGTAALFGAPDYSNLPALADLAEANSEITEIAALYKDANRLASPPITGDAAREAKFWDILATDRPDIVHICCHADAASDSPMTAGLICVDGKIDAAEIGSRRISCREVFLSACSTGYRPASVGELELHGDDILGLPGAFLEAGATTILVSIPEAEDAAAKAFAVHYHHQRIAGESPLLAYQNTQKFMASERKFDPMSWIGFVLYGGV